MLQQYIRLNEHNSQLNKSLKSQYTRNLTMIHLHFNKFNSPTALPPNVITGSRLLVQSEPKSLKSPSQIHTLHHYIRHMIPYAWYTAWSHFWTTLEVKKRLASTDSIELYSRTSTASKFTFWIIFSTRYHNSVQFHLPQHIMSFIETSGQGFKSSTRHSAVRLLRPFESVILFSSRF